MSETEKILAEEFESIRKDLIAKHIALGMKASGKWAKSLENIIEAKAGDFSAQIIGEKYTEQLSFGRRPGKFPPIKAIKQWIIDKGLPLKDIKLSSLAFLIARKIAKSGTKYYQQGGTDLVTSVVTPERIQKIINRVATVNVSTLVSGLITELKKPI